MLSLTLCPGNPQALWRWTEFVQGGDTHGVGVSLRSNLVQHPERYGNLPDALKIIGKSEVYPNLSKVAIAALVIPASTANNNLCFQKEWQQFSLFIVHYIYFTTPGLPSLPEYRTRHHSMCSCYKLWVIMHSHSSSQIVREAWASWSWSKLNCEAGWPDHTECSDDGQHRRPKCVGVPIRKGLSDLDQSKK